MTLVRATAVGLLIAAATTTHAEDKKAKFDPAKVVGEWTITEGVKDGEKLEKDKLKGAVTFAEKSITIKGDDMTFKFSYTIDAAAQPAAIDMEIVEPDGLKGSKAKGIVAWDGDKLKLAYNPAGKDRPKDFAAKKESGDFSFVLAKKAK